MSKLYLMMGQPGSGKSTFVKQHLSENAVWVSRDKIRFSMVREDEPYFSKETLVFNEFIRQINEALDQGKDVYADATHLNKSSRIKTLRMIHSPKRTETNVIWVKVPLELSLERNEYRRGTRAYVPRDQLEKMYYAMAKPDFSEGYSSIILVEPDTSIKIYKMG